MTKKRFTLREPKIDGGIGCSEIANNGEWITYGEIVDLLNENEELKKENNKWIVEYNGLNTEYQLLKEENNKLNSILEEMKDKNGEIWLMDGRIIRLKKVLK